MGTVMPVVVACVVWTWLPCDGAVHYVTDPIPGRAWSKRHFPDPYDDKHTCGHMHERGVNEWLCDPTKLITVPQGPMNTSLKQF